MADNGLIYMIKRIGARTEPEEHLSVQEQMQNNDYIERRSLYDQSDKMKTIGGQYQLIQSQYGDVAQG